MKRAFFLLVLLCLAVSSVSGITPSTVPDNPRAKMSSLGAADACSLAQHPEVTAAIRLLDAWIEATVNAREQPGLSVGIVYDQELIWAKGYGFADLGKKILATPSTVYRIGSISKVFTATAILQLRDAGKLQLDDPVVKHLPWFKIKNPYLDAPRITIWHLLTHTSGLPADAAGVDFNSYTGPQREEMIRLLAEQEVLSPAETRASYSNLGYVILGEIVAAVTGEPFAQYIENHILTPLSMAATDLEPDATMPGLAVGYGPRKRGVPREAQPFVDTRFYTPAGDGASTVEDMARFVSFQLSNGSVGGAHILKGSTLREMHRVHWLLPDWSRGRGLGFGVHRVSEQIRFGHGGDSLGFLAGFEIAPDDKLGVIVLTNAIDGDPRHYLNQAFSILTPAVAHATAPPETMPIPDPAWDKYIGRYTAREWGFEVHVLVLKGELTMIDPNDDNPWESRVRLKPVGVGTFRMIEGEEQYGELLRFEVDSEGRVTGLRGPSYYLPRE